MDASFVNYPFDIVRDVPELRVARVNPVALCNVVRFKAGVPV
jgi:hypothetical protein